MKKELQEPPNQYILSILGQDHLLDLEESALDQSYLLGPHQPTVQHLYLCICMIKAMSMVITYTHACTHIDIMYMCTLINSPSNRVQVIIEYPDDERG